MPHCKQQKIKVKVVNLYSASSQACARLLCTFVTNQSRLPHGHHVQPADTGWRIGRLGNPSQLYPTFRNSCE